MGTNQKRGGACPSNTGFDLSKRPSLGRCCGHLAESDMSKRPWLGRCSGRSAKQPAPHLEHKHLYLVVDDWEKGYSIYRIDDDDLESSLDTPLVRMEAQHPYSWSFVAHGTKILAMQPNKSSPGIPMFDTETLGVSVCSYPLSRGDIGGKPVYASVGDKLLAFYYPFVEVLMPELTPSEGKGDTLESLSWITIEKPPFVSAKVSSYAVHPDGRTIFMSVRNWRPGGRGTVSDSLNKTWNSIFTFDMERLEWTYIGEWILPFKGRAHYDRELDAWVGLCLYKEGAGHLCCCDIPPASGCETMPSWKLGRDVFFDPKGSQSEVHLGATLLYKGDSRFCLLESRMPRDADSSEYSERIRLVKMTSFALKYDKDGDLRATHHSAHASISYQIAHKRIDRHENPVAFWI